MNMPIDKNKLFNLFPESNRDPDDMTDHEIEVNIVESIIYKLKKYLKIVSNHQVFFASYTMQMKQADPKFDAEATKRQAAFVVYNRSWHYIKDFNLDDEDHLRDLVLINPYDLSYALQLSIKYFESTEEYEKCAHLFKIQQFLEVTVNMTSSDSSQEEQK